MTPFFNDLQNHVNSYRGLDYDDSTHVFVALTWHLTHPPIHMQATAISESK